MGEAEEDVSFELGDKVIVIGGSKDGTRGRIYYLDEDAMRILPEGVSDRLVELPLVDGDFDPDLGIDRLYLISKRPNPAFVAQIDAQKGETLDSFGINGEPGLSYTVEDINEEEDRLVLIDPTGGRIEIEFIYGIPRDLPFAVLRPSPKPEAGRNSGAAGAEGEENELLIENVTEENLAPLPEPTPAEENTGGIIEIPEYQQLFPDSVQRNDALRDFLEQLSLVAQKNPRKQKVVRTLVEQCLQLRNELIEYSEAGDPKKIRPTSFQSIAELLETSDIPLARPVLDAKRSLYLDHSPIEGDDVIELPGRAVDLQYMARTLQQSNTFLETQLGGVAEGGAAPDALPAWFLTWELFFRRFLRSWASGGEGGGESVVFQGDKEFFRAPAPKEGEEEVDGIPRGAKVTEEGPTEEEEAAEEAALLLAAAAEEAGDGEDAAGEPGEAAAAAGAAPRRAKTVKGITSAALVSKIPFSLLKGTGPRYLRLRNDAPPRKIESGDEGVITNQLIFPLKTERDLGSTRTGSLAKDIALSQLPQKGMRQILKELGSVPDTATAGSILSLGVGGNTSGQIAIEDWLKNQPFTIQGLGDARIALKNLGLTQRELTVAQQETLIEKVKQIRALVKEHITKLREDAKAELGKQRLETDPFLQGAALEDLLATITTEPLLADRAEQISAMLPAYRGTDIALFAGLSASMADLLLTAMAQAPGPLARERNRVVRDQYVEALRKGLRKAQKKAMAGEEPRPINCIHMPDLEVIRKATNPDQRMELLSKFLARYKRAVVDNWVLCTEGDHHLMCYHEALQIQEYKFPREKETIHKELLLKFSGGIFHGKYMCKNCGQPIQDLDFDNGMEFDDEGRPLAGRGQLVDRDALAEEEIEQALGGPATKAEPVSFDTPTQELIYKTAKELFNQIGIYADMADYKRIIERVEGEIQKQPSREEYAKVLKARAKKGEAAGRALDYDVLINRILASAVAAHVLIEIQTHIPDFIPRYRLPGCPASFSGYPLGAEKDDSGIRYISCAVGSIRRNEPPWNLTGFMTVTSEQKRTEAIMMSVKKLVAEAVTTAMVQQIIQAKQAHLTKIYGSAAYGDRIQEAIPAGFKPLPYAVTPEEAAEAIVVAEGATSEEAVRGWIQTSHRIARKNGSYIRGSPFSESSCCFAPLARPRAFWGDQDASMPALPKKRAPRGQAGSQTLMPFSPRRKPRLLTDPPEDLFYRVFLRLCYDGPRKGLPHEPGYTNECMHCGFVFPENPYIPVPNPPLSNNPSEAKAMMAEWQKEVDAIVQRGKAALEAQKVPMTRETFQELLDTSHLSYQVELPEKEKPTIGVGLLAKLMNVTPEPFEGFRAILSTTIAAVRSLPPGADRIAVAEAYSEMSNKMVEYFGDIQRRLGAFVTAPLKDLLERQTPSQIAESLRAYILIPFTRLLNGFNTKSLFIQSSYDLPPPTLEAIEKAMALHLGYLAPIKKHVKGYTEIKMIAARDRLQQVLPILQNDLRSQLIPGGEGGLQYVVGTLVLGILAEFVNPNVLPEASGGARAGTVGTVDATARAPLAILETCLGRFQTEGLRMTEQQIRDILAERKEDEKQTFISQLDRLSPEDRAMAMRIKKYGLKEWAVGGTKAVRTLDPTLLERERARREEMGIEDFGGDPYANRSAQLFGADEVYGGGGGEAGYDVYQPDD